MRLDIGRIDQRIRHLPVTIEVNNNLFWQRWTFTTKLNVNFTIRCDSTEDFINMNNPVEVTFYIVKYELAGNCFFCIFLINHSIHRLKALLV